jgi:predicted nucleotidyltransferase
MNMADDTEKLSLLEVARLLQRHQVEYLVIGGQAAVLMGSPIATYDVDLCYRRSPENLSRLAEALREIHPTLRGAPADLPFRLDAQSLALGANFTFNTDSGPLDLIGWVEPLGSYDDLVQRAEKVSLGDVSVMVIGLEDLIAIKRHLRRPKDEATLFQLEALKRLRDQR